VCVLSDATVKARLSHVPTSNSPRPVPNLHTAAQPRADYRRWVPNALTGLRLLIAIAFFVLLSVWNYPARMLLDLPAVEGRKLVTPIHPVWPYLIAAALFGLAALTDALDGPLARRWKTVSKFGRVMDPFADKVLVVGAFIMLAGPTFGVDVEGQPPFQVSGITSWMVVIILGRELLVTSIRSVMEESGVDFSARLSGKLKMVVQACVIPFILIMLGITVVGRGTWGRLIIDIAAYTTVAITVLSGIPYIRGAIAASAWNKS
jgi:CDP-diacylglycerol--glycerol-3-phosphate 3-phosphatidyltransferase